MVMVVSRSLSDGPSILVSGQPIERVCKYRYLGTWVTEDWDSHLEIKTRIEIARSAFNSMRNVLCNQNLKVGLRTRLLHCYIWPIVQYGCESWTIKEDLRKRIEAFEMWAYRRMLRISWRQKITNVEVLRRAQQKRALWPIIKKRKTSYLGHVLRHYRYELLQVIMMGKVVGRRRVGRKRKSWLRDIREWTGITNASELFHLAKEDGDRFRQLVADLH